MNMSIEQRFSPIGLSRIILNHKYKNKSKHGISEMLRNPNIIDDSLLAINISTCLFNDNRDGPISDIIRNCIGEEYELKLKMLAKQAGLYFFDEFDLRQTGFDKTPDIKLAIPCMYKGSVVNWIESKASFGDMDSHKKYFRDQLASYGNR